MKEQKKPSLSNTKIAVVFFAFLVFVIGLSLVFKIIGVVSAGQFDGSRRFILAITNGKNMEVVSLSSISKSIAVFKLDDKATPSEAGRLLAVPIDGFIASEFLNLDQAVRPLFMNATLNYNSLKTDLTIIDIFRIAMLTRAIPENSITVKKVRVTAGLEADKIVGRLATDDLIEKDHQTIRIINGTDVFGLGNRLARLITNMGGNVIIVGTSDSPKKSSIISYIDKKTYTVERLQKVLGYKAVKEEDSEISDITIVIGDDKANSSPF